MGVFDLLSSGARYVGNNMKQYARDVEEYKAKYEQYDTDRLLRLYK